MTFVTFVSICDDPSIVQLPAGFLLDKRHLTRHLTQRNQFSQLKSRVHIVFWFVWTVSAVARIKYGFLCLLTHWHVIDRHEAWGFGQVDQMDPVIFDIMQFSKPIFDGYNQNCIKIQLLSCWSLRHQPIKKNKQIMRNEASSKECTANSILPVRINLFLDYFIHWIIKSHSIHLCSIQIDT